MHVLNRVNDSKPRMYAPRHLGLLHVKSDLGLLHVKSLRFKLINDINQAARAPLTHFKLSYVLVNPLLPLMCMRTAIASSPTWLKSDLDPAFATSCKLKSANQFKTRAFIAKQNHAPTT